MEILKESMSEIFIQERLCNALEAALCCDEDYRSIKQKVREVNNRLGKGNQNYGSAV